MLGLGGVFVALVLGWSFLVQPAMESIHKLDQSITRHRRDLTHLQAMAGRWREMKSQSRVLVEKLAGREKDFSLASHLEELIQASGLKGNLTILRPLPVEAAASGLTRVLVEIKLEKVPIEGLTKLLYRIEFSDKLLTVTRLSLKSAAQGLDVTLRVLTLAQNKQAA